MTSIDKQTIKNVDKFDNIIDIITSVVTEENVVLFIKDKKDNLHILSIVILDNKVIDVIIKQEDYATIDLKFKVMFIEETICNRCGGLFNQCNTCYTPDTDPVYLDIMRVLDDIDYDKTTIKLKNVKDIVIEKILL